MLSLAFTIEKTRRNAWRRSTEKRSEWHVTNPAVPICHGFLRFLLVLIPHSISVLQVTAHEPYSAQLLKRLTIISLIQPPSPSAA